jgi:hypothetical protein
MVCTLYTVPVVYEHWFAVEQSLATQFLSTYTIILFMVLPVVYEHWVGRGAILGHSIPFYLYH